MSNKASYDKSACSICGRQISENGFGYISHMRSHVRRGEAIESRDNIGGPWRLIFKPRKQHKV